MAVIRILVEQVPDSSSKECGRSGGTCPSSRVLFRNAVSAAGVDASRVYGCDVHAMPDGRSQGFLEIGGTVE